MRLRTRVRALERRTTGNACACCRGNGWPDALVAGAPAAARPPGWPAGCRVCGRVNMDAVTWIGLGPRPTAEAARAFLEAV